MSTLTTELVDEETYQRLALADPQGQLELHEGRLWEKPGMSVEHGDLTMGVALALAAQLDPAVFRVRTSHARLRRSAVSFYIPDIAVIPTALVEALRQRPGSLDLYAVALPLVLEIWSPSTGDYGIAEKLPEYMARGDREIWYLHPYERTLLASRRQPDGTYVETRYTHGSAAVHSLPGVEVDLDALFAQ